MEGGRHQDTKRLMLIQADSLHIPLADKSVNCVVTSPPYWGLRDYGTATWEGGDDCCDHKGPPMRTNNKPSNKNSSFHGGDTRADEVFKLICFKCGARRIDKQLGLESTPDEYLANMVGVFREVWRVLKDDGTIWVNLGDSYASDFKGSGGSNPKQDSNKGSRFNGNRLKHSLKPKDLCGIPWRTAFALQADGWYLRQDIIWSKPNPMPESVTDRCTKSHEYVFLLSKSQKYYYDAGSIREKADYGYTPKPGMYDRLGIDAIRTRVGSCPDGTGGKRNKRSVWEIPTQAYPEAHFATFPEDLIKPCILAGCPKGGIVLDPFVGSGTTIKVSEELNCKGVGLDLSWEYLELARKRNNQSVMAF